MTVTSTIQRNLVQNLKVPLQWATCPLDTERHLLPCSHDTPAIGELLVKLCDPLIYDNKIRDIQTTTESQQRHSN